MNTAITGNEGGGFSFQNVGELNPTVLIEGCRIQNCGLKMLNMTSPGIIDMYIQVSTGCLYVIRIHISRNYAHYLILKYPQNCTSGSESWGFFSCVHSQCKSALFVLIVIDYI